jgi:YD repeat-containing protein
MSTKRKVVAWILVAILALIGILAFLLTPNRADVPLLAVTGKDPQLTAPEAETVPTMGVAKPIGWKANEVPQAAKGLAVTRFADGLVHPRTLYTLPNGDVLVALTNRPDNGPGGITGLVMNWLFRRAGADTPSPNQIVLLRDTDHDGRADQRSVLTGAVKSPGGMAWRDGTLYVGDSAALVAFPYQLGQTRIDGAPKKLMDLPGGGMHWMRNVALSPDGKRIYVSVGSSSNVAEGGIDKEQGRAAIWEYNLVNGSSRIFGGGMRNPNGMAFNPWTGELWTVVNERDMLGPDIVPDYLTNVPIGANYGWPWVYWGNNFDDRVDAPQPSGFNPAYIRKPQFALGPHVAALGLVFSGAGARMGADYASGAFIAEHGSWNRQPLSGYQVVYVPFDKNGNPVGKPQPVLGGFLTSTDDTHGRPTWLTWAGDGALLVSDDTAGIIWRVIAPGAQPQAAIAKLKGESLPPQRELHGLDASFGEEHAIVVPR